MDFQRAQRMSMQGGGGIGGPMGMWQNANIMEEMMDPSRGKRMSTRNSMLMEEMMEPSRGKRMSTRNSMLTEEMMVDPSPGKRMSTRNSMRMEEMVPLQRQMSKAKRDMPQIPEVNHKKHTCTDLHCLVIFACFIATWFFIAHYAITRGNLNNVVIPADSNNRKCGIDSGVTNKPYLYFFDLDKCLDPEVALHGCKTKQVCVDQCPQESFVWGDHVQDSELEHVKQLLICDDDVDKGKLRSRQDINATIAQGRCSGLYVKSSNIFNHCLPISNQDLCRFLPESLKNRRRRSASDIFDRFVEFQKRTADLCRQNDTTADLLLKQKVQQSQSSVTKIIAAIIAKFGSSNDMANNERLAEDITTDLKSSWKVVLMAFIIHIAFALVFIALLRWLAKPLVWISIVGVILGLVLGLYYSIKQYKFYSAYPQAPQHNPNLIASLKNLLHSQEFWKWLSVFVGAVLLIVFLIVMVLRKRICVAVALIKEASKAITSIKSSIFFPIFPGVLYILVSVMTIIVLLYLNSIGRKSFRLFTQLKPNAIYLPEQCECGGPAISYELDERCEPETFEKFCHILGTNKSCVETVCRFVEIEKQPKIIWAIYFCVFTYFWVTFFISAYGDMVLACTFSMWYWTFDKKKNLASTPLLKAIGNTTLYHLGTVAFGSLILATCRMIRYLLEMLEKRLKMYENKVTEALLCCMKCFFWLLENFLRFLNRNAYITCAIHSTSFCASSQQAFRLITQNILRMYAIDKVSDFVFFLSKILLTSLTCCATYAVLVTYPNIFIINYPLVPISLVIILGYIMAEVIFSTYGMAVDTLFFCFLEDINENDGSEEKPYYMSKNLNRLMNSKRAMRRVKK
ncbi:choline transporter-like 2 [Musca vetustissima]|uniref:choline transporter-like 2 n=1 Tax=Musca vetustissima TaxID=27455 RepID=UPI002AB5DE79|nr:choline transporter-like 2 [Musca vetustissima]